ncbi:VCBS repeat-containing protein [Lysobacter sp. 5GHs7-4]|uniref:FG-GAP repeat domain-containing protein n=1 Tax=Lysobacter sp. 5GHs7-4 TaxID=2904253 RepID=UPI001E3CA6A9|nr:VCBS repeat-containing protein [Lysobacter sp. 5GHs7-4]UHQ22681.1 VCBS repeat-containing protein [Lysobacter sp. 5GHs7-4]
MKKPLLQTVIAMSLVAACADSSARSPDAGYTPWRLSLPRSTESAPVVPRKLQWHAQPAPTVPSQAASLMRTAQSDFDGDGRSDLLWTQTYSKSPRDRDYMSYWRMNGPQIFSAHNFAHQARVPPGSVGDFNGDGRADVLFSALDWPGGLWLGRGDGGFDVRYVTGPNLPPEIRWKRTRVPESVDLNGDGRDDVLVVNRDLQRAGYVLMDGPTALGAVSFDLASGYSLNGAGDFDGDGLDDLLCAYDAGHLYLWRNRGDGGFDVSLIAVYDPNWSVVGNPDLNGDGRADIVWRGPNGMLAFWWLDGSSIIRADTKWAGSRDVATGDFDGDGLEDVAWTQASTAYAFLWRSRGDGEFDSYLLGQFNLYWDMQTSYVLQRL